MTRLLARGPLLTSALAIVIGIASAQSMKPLPVNHLPVAPHAALRIAAENFHGLVLSL